MTEVSKVDEAMRAAFQKIERILQDTPERGDFVDDLAQQQDEALCAIHEAIQEVSNVWRAQATQSQDQRAPAADSDGTRVSLAEPVVAKSQPQSEAGELVGGKLDVLPDYINVDEDGKSEAEIEQLKDGLISQLQEADELQRTVRELGFKTPLEAIKSLRAKPAVEAGAVAWMWEARRGGSYLWRTLVAVVHPDHLEQSQNVEVRNIRPLGYLTPNAADDALRTDWDTSWTIRESSFGDYVTSPAFEAGNMIITGYPLMRVQPKHLRLTGQCYVRDLLKIMDEEGTDTVYLMPTISQSRVEINRADLEARNPQGSKP